MIKGIFILILFVLLVIYAPIIAVILLLVWIAAILTLSL